MLFQFLICNKLSKIELPLNKTQDFKLSLSRSHETFVLGDNHGTGTARCLQMVDCMKSNDSTPNLLLISNRCINRPIALLQLF